MSLLADPAALELLPAPAFAPSSPLPEVLERIFSEPSGLSEIQWDEANIVLDEKESRTNPGPYRAHVTPHARAIRTAFGDPALRQVTVKKNDQAAITRHVLNFICRLVAERPRNILYIIDSLQEAKRISRRLMDALNSCPATRQRMDEEEDGDLQTLTLFLRDMTVYFVGGGSLGAVANKQIAVIIVDEADKIPRLTGKQAHVVDEGKSRFKSVPAGDALMIVLSKPNQEVDITTVEYRKGTMEKGFMPCPHCGLLQEFLQERLRYDHCKLPGGDHDLARVLEETHYLCVQAGSAACPDGRIYDHHRTFTCDRIEYRPTNPNPEPGHRSFEVSDFLLNPVHFPDARFGRIAIDMIEGFKNPVKMKSVQAGRFGKEELLQRAELKQDDILKLRGNYRRGTAPRGLVYCGIFSDVQGSGPKWVKYGFRRNGELVVIDWGAFLVLDDLIPESLTVEIPEVDESVPLAADVDQPRTGRLLRPQQGWIDEGDEQKQVLSFCIRSSFFFLPTKGRGGYQTRGTTIVAESPRDHELQQFVAYHFNDDQFKKELYVHRIRDHEKIIAGKKPNTPRIWVPHDIDEALMLELTNERLTIKKDARGFTQEEWEKTGPNDYGDGVKGALISWHVMGPRILSELAAADKAAAAKPPPPAN